MSRLKEVISERAFAGDLLEIVGTMQEISVLQMQQIRDSVLQTREFMNGILDIFQDVRVSKQREIEQIVKRKQNTTQALPNPTQALVFISPKSRFSDANISHVFQAFQQATKEYPTADLVVVGEVGKQFLDENGPWKHKVVFLSLPDKIVRLSDLTETVDQLAQYDRVQVFHGEFVNLLQQQVRAHELTGSTPLLEDTPQNTDKHQRQFLFEPSIDRIVDFFEQEIFRSLLQQTVSESRLAHVGSRVTRLEQSRGVIERHQETLLHRQRLLQRSLNQKKQLQRLAGIALWH